ncbi:hypothetical protein [Sinisalibacter aestuarii]|uniref:Uncharacterized protein n=1 Tax=Sinisalibacter aestuarii TaxID=2949426 RepID=A0ABQ5LWE0_9RHOB|nr:hypothetical protein [Sinisalibacter aestuarii]GKY89295.1 hypothetical protein STA1M1_31640 [Sinisalibacter aestuarii]
MKAWAELTTDEQLQLRLDYQAHLDSLPPTCSLDDKVTAFANWLAERDVGFSLEDVSRRRPRD